MPKIDEIKIIRENSDDNRSYHINSEKIKNILGYSPKRTIENAVEDLHEAFKKQLFKDPLSNEEYYNIKKMNNINLK